MTKIEEVYEHLWQEIHRTNELWSLWCNWYSNDPARVEILNEEANTTFSLLQTTVLESVLLALSRMADRNRIAGKETASFDNLIQMVGLDDDVHERHQEFIAAVDKIRCWRNSHIAHKDLAKIIAGPDHVVKVNEVGTCLRSALNLHNAISQQLGKSCTFMLTETHVGVDVINAFKRSKHLKRLVSEEHLHESELFLALDPPPAVRPHLEQQIRVWRQAISERTEDS